MKKIENATDLKQIRENSIKNSGKGKTGPRGGETAFKTAGENAR